MRRPTQGLLLGFLGAVLLRLALSDAYLRYVTTWMKWPVVASGVLLLALAVGPVLDQRSSDDADDADAHDAHDGEGHDPDQEEHDLHGHDHGGVPKATWLLLLPGLVAFMIAPPALGSYLAERRADEAVVATPAVIAPVADGDVVPLEVAEFLWRAQDGGDTLKGRTVDLTGFVSYDDAGSWFVTRLSISCCAADATAYRVQVKADGTPPPRDQWVKITGVYVDGTGQLDTGGNHLASTATLEAVDIQQTTEPSQTYS